MKEKIRRFIYDIVADALSNRKAKVDVEMSADIARLIVDMKNNSLSLKTRAFLCRMNIEEGIK